LKPKQIKKTHNATAANQVTFTAALLNHHALSPGREINKIQSRPPYSSAATSTTQTNASPTEKLKRRQRTEEAESNHV
jgi:hypothetical protein